MSERVAALKAANDWIDNEETLLDLILAQRHEAKIKALTSFAERTQGEAHSFTATASEDRFDRGYHAACVMFTKLIRAEVTRLEGEKGRARRGAGEAG